MSQKELDDQPIPGVARPDKASVKREIWEWTKSLGMAVIVALVIKAYIFEPVRVDGPSMESTLFSNQVMAVSKFTYRLNEPKRGDIAVCRFNQESTNYVKRVIGLPGETVEIRDGTVHIDGAALDEPYVDFPARQDFGPVTVPEGTYLLFGDNRNNSTDSRYSSVGSIPRDRLVGRVEAILWPLGDIHMVKHQ